MARGRFITNGITSDKKINDLSDDTSRLAFTWLITFADCEGRTHGDPAMVRSMLFPRRTDVTIERMEAYLTEWQAAGLVRIYSANGDKWLDFPNFGKHQTGLRKDHEAASSIPPFESGTTTELLRSKDVAETPQIKVSKEKIKDKVSQGSADKPRPARAETPPSVEAYKRAAHRYPNKSLYQTIADAVGVEDSAVSFWENVVKAYISLGWNPANITGQLEWFERRELPHKNGNGRHAPESTGNAMLDAIKRAQQEPGYYDDISQGD